MPSPDVELCLVSDFTQKCTIPLRYFTMLKAKIGDYLTIHCNDNYSIVNRAYPSFHMKNVAISSDVVFKQNKLSITVPKILLCSLESFKLNSMVSLQRIQVHVVVKSIGDVVRWEFVPDLELCVKGILMRYVVSSGSFVKCDEYTQDLTGILKIEAVNIYCDENVVGRTTERTELEIIRVTSAERLEQVALFENTQLGGMDPVLSLMKNFYFFSSRDPKNCSFDKILLTGPSGCGKSSLVRKLALDMDSYLITITHRDLYSMNKLECSNFFQTLTKAAKLHEKNPCILFIDNLEAVNDNSEEKRKILYLMLAVVDMTSRYKNIPVVGAAISSKFVHPEFRKPERFSKEIHLGVPTCKQREQMLKIMTKDFSPEVDIFKIARATSGYIASDLKLLCLEAKRRLFDSKSERTNALPTTGDLEQALMVVRPSLLQKSRFVTNVQAWHWGDIGGIEEIKKRVTISIEWPLVHPEAFSKVGLPCPKGVLLYGPPGCCKTTLVRVLATECSAAFFSASPAQIYSPFVGDSEKSITELFYEARLCAPSIIFLDEIDNLVGRRSYDRKQSGVQEKVLSALLNEMDGFGVNVESYQEIEELSQNVKPKNHLNNRNVIVVGATNRIDLIDDALLRPGRFDSVLYVPPPNKKQREAILKLQLCKMKLQDADLSWVAEHTDGFSGADLKNLCRIVSLSAFKSDSCISTSHFEKALEITHPSITKSQLQEYERLAAKYGPTM